MDERTGDHADWTTVTPDEFAADLDLPAYVPRGYELADAPDGPADGGADAGGGTDALDAVLGVLDREDAAVVVVAGESGAGRTRLLAEVGRALGDEETVRYVRGSRGAVPPAVDGGTVLCLDDAGRLADPDRFLRLAADPDRAVRVVAAVRPAHAGTLDAGVLPDAVPRYEVSLDPLDEGGTVDLLAADDVPAERARAIHGAAGGNPFLSRRLAHAAVDPADADAVRDAVVSLLPDEGFPVDAGRARSLLAVVAALGTYDPDAAADIDPFDDPADRRRALDALCDDGLLATEAGEGDAYALRSGVVAEYLRSRALADESGVYGAAVDRRLGTDAVGIARGLVDLRRSPLVRVGAVDAADAAGRVRSLLADVAGGVVDADAPLADVLRVQALVALVAPGAVPYDALEARYEAADPTAAHAGPLYRFVAVLYRHASATAADEYDLPVPPSALLAHARSWLDRLNALAIDRPGDAGLQRRLARALRTAATHEAAAGRFDGARTCLDRLDVLAGDNPDSDEVRLALATALGDAAGAAGAAGRVDDLGSHVDRLDALAADHPDHGGVRRALATALVNATNYEGEAGRFGALSDRVDRLADLADADPADDELQHRLAQGLLNAASAEGGDGRFEALDARLDRLSALADANPASDEIRHRFAQALLGAVDDEAAAGRFEALDARLDRLSAIADANPEQAEHRRRLAQALLAAVDSETDAGRFEGLDGRLARLSALATEHPDDGAVQVPTTGAFLLALRHLVDAARYEEAAEVVAALETLAARPDGLPVGGKGADVTDLATATGEDLLRAGRLDLFERFAAVLADGLSGGRWRSVSSDLIMSADSLVAEGTVGMDAYRRVVECCDD